MNKNNILSEQDIQSLPQCVQNYIRYSKTLGKERIARANIKQTGFFKLKEKWYRMQATQRFDFVHKSFVWNAKIGIARVTDQYVDEKGLLKVLLLGFFKVAELKGDEIDQGEVLRLLAEMIWFPSALTADYIEWQAVDMLTARACIKYGDQSASADFYFEQDGRLVSVKAKRYKESNGKFSLEDWEASNFEYGEFNGKWIPYKGEVLWTLKDLVLCYCKMEIVQMDEDY